VENLVQPFLDFHPGTKTVLWRTLIINAHLCRAIMRNDGVHPIEAITEQEQDRFDWGAGPGPMLAARRYLRDH
jgi:hypothetical protein